MFITKIIIPIIIYASRAVFRIQDVLSLIQDPDTNIFFLSRILQ
jgi:hypothetical protein